MTGVQTCALPISVDLKGGQGILTAMNKTVADIEKNSANIEFPMIKLMRGTLKELNQIKPVSTQDKPTKNNQGNVRVSGDVTVSTINRKGF